MLFKTSVFFGVLLQFCMVLSVPLSSTTVPHDSAHVLHSSVGLYGSYAALQDSATVQKHSVSVAFLYCYMVLCSA